MSSDGKRLQEVMSQIDQIKTGSYPIVVGQPGQYRIEERPWKDIQDRSKLAILQGAIDWTGITNRDQGHILLSQVDPGKITDSQRNSLIGLAVDQRGDTPQPKARERDGRER